MISSLQRHLSALAVEGVAAGVHLVLRLPDHVDDAKLASEAREAGIGVPALSAYSLERANARPGLVLGYGRLHEAAVNDAIRALARVVRGHL
jgi:GntR family transcriptional regulator / MocR family aminotransferase